MKRILSCFRESSDLSSCIQKIAMTLREAWEFVEKGEKLIEEGDYEGAMKSYVNAYRLFLSRKKKRALREVSFTLELLAQKLRSLALEQKKNGEYENAARYLLMAADIYALLEKNDNREDIKFELGLLAISLRDEARSFLKNGAPFEAIRYLNISLGICRKLNDPSCEGHTLLLLSVANAIIGKSKKAFKSLKDAISILEKVNDTSNIEGILLDFADIIPENEKTRLFQFANIRPK